MDTFLLFKKVFNMDQSGFQFLWTLSKLFANLSSSCDYLRHLSSTSNGFAETLVSQFAQCFCGGFDFS